MQARRYRTVWWDGKWTVVDKNDTPNGAFYTRREAREHCKKLNEAERADRDQSREETI